MLRRCRGQWKEVLTPMQRDELIEAQAAKFTDTLVRMAEAHNRLTEPQKSLAHSLEVACIKAHQLATEKNEEQLNRAEEDLYEANLIGDEKQIAKATIALKEVSAHELDQVSDFAKPLRDALQPLSRQPSPNEVSQLAISQLTSPVLLTDAQIQPLVTKYNKFLSVGEATKAAQLHADVLKLLTPEQKGVILRARAMRLSNEMLQHANATAEQRHYAADLIDNLTQSAEFDSDWPTFQNLLEGKLCPRLTRLLEETSKASKPMVEPPQRPLISLPPKP
jgi:hypothetical protein